MVLSWLMEDERSAAALLTRDRLLAAEEIWTPSHLPLEVANALRVAERRKRLNAAGLAEAVAVFSMLPVTTDTETGANATGQTLALARQHSISVYDAAYLELAMRRGASLASLDEPLCLIAKRLHVPLVTLDS